MFQSRLAAARQDSRPACGCDGRLPALAPQQDGFGVAGIVTPGERLVPIPEAVLTRLIARMGPLESEYLLLFCLDATGNALCSRVLGSGGAGSLTAGFRTLVEQALACEARGLIIVHNHPSGDARPSEIDVRSTRHLQALARPLDLTLFDHLVVSRRAAFSMRHAGLIDRHV